ncbi:MAG: dTDP-glucose 4,6-dehydratase [Terriglobia bacterium]
MKLLVTGGAGFIGSNFIRYLLTEHGAVTVTNLDRLTYAGNLENLADISDDPRFEKRYRFVQGDIAEAEALAPLFSGGFDAVVNFAAETHVDRSIESAAPFLRTNILGAHALLEAARRYGVERFLQISTDEVYGSAPAGVSFTEQAALRPSSPYAASKTAADLLVLSYVHTYGFPAVVLRCSNNYGPYQFPEKLLPLMIANALEEKPLPVYGDGLHVRDWIHVEDHCRAVRRALQEGRVGEVYNIGGVAQRTNLEVVRTLLGLLGKPESLITFVEDRPGHDRRYALDSTKLRHELDWAPCHTFEEGLAHTVEWYRSHPQWLAHCRSGAYRDYYQRHYEQRGQLLARMRASGPRGES